MKVGDVCNRLVIFVTEDEAVQRAAELMRKYHVGTLIVTEYGDEDRHPIGVVTDRDIVVGVIAKGIEPEEVKVGDIMSENPLVANEEDDITAALDAMRDHGVRRVPVRDAGSKLIGVLALDDLLQYIANCMNDVAVIVGTQRHHESKVRV